MSCAKRVQRIKGATATFRSRCADGYGAICNNGAPTRGIVELLHRSGTEVTCGDLAGWVGAQHRQERRAAPAPYFHKMLWRLLQRQDWELQQQVAALLELACSHMLDVKGFPAAIFAPGLLVVPGLLCSIRQRLLVHVCDDCPTKRLLRPQEGLNFLPASQVESCSR